MEDLRNQTKKDRAAAFFDIKGAFDGVLWPPVIESLKAKNASNELIDIMKSYLEDRSVLQ